MNTLEGAQWQGCGVHGIPGEVGDLGLFTQEEQIKEETKERIQRIKSQVLSKFAAKGQEATDANCPTNRRSAKEKMS